MRIEREKLDRIIKEFIQNIGKGPFKHLNDETCNYPQSVYLVKSSTDGYENIFQCAVAQAWLDMCRTTNGDSDDAIRQYFSDELRKIYEQESTAALEDLIYSTADAVRGLTVGQKQKIINMANKYLYCCEDIRNNAKYQHVFESAHMPLDTNILEWYERIVVEWRIKNHRSFPGKKAAFYKSKVCDWSKLNETNRTEDIFTDQEGKEFYSYGFFQRTIREYINETFGSADSISPLEVEFLVWPEIKLLLATEAFIFSISSQTITERKTIRSIHSIKSNIEMKSELISNDFSSINWFK